MILINHPCFCRVWLLQWPVNHLLPGLVQSLKVCYAWLSWRPYEQSYLLRCCNSAATCLRRWLFIEVVPILSCLLSWSHERVLLRCLLSTRSSCVVSNFPSFLITLKSWVDFKSNRLFGLMWNWSCFFCSLAFQQMNWISSPREMTKNLECSSSGAHFSDIYRKNVADVVLSAYLLVIWCS